MRSVPKRGRTDYTNSTTSNDSNQPLSPTALDVAWLPQAEGVLSATQLERILAAEREALATFVVQRHSLLLADLNAKLTTDMSTGQVQDLQNEHAVVDRITTAGPFHRNASSGEMQTSPEGILSTTHLPLSDEGVARGEQCSTEFLKTDEGIPEEPCSHESPKSEGEVAWPVTTFERHPSAGSQSTGLSELKQQMGKRPVSDTGNFFSRLVQDWRWDIMVAGVIMCNALAFAFEIQCDGIDLGNLLGYRRYPHSSEQTWCGSRLGFFLSDYAFGIVFILELIAKVLAHKSAWLRDCWNYLDAMSVAAWLIEQPLNGALQLPADATLIRSARLFRLVRLLKLLRTLQGADALYLMLTTLKGCLSILGWSCILLLVTQMLIAILFCFSLHESYFKDERYPLEERKEVFQYFGTMSRSMLTMFEMTLANWPPVCRLLVENVNEWFSLFCILHKLTMGFAVIGVINGVFMQETFKVAASDDHILLQQRERDVKIHAAKLERLFRAADESGDGVVDIDEFRTIVQDEEVLGWLSSLDIAVRDPNVLFRLIDKESNGELTCEEFVKGGLMLRGAAKTIDVIEIKRQLAAMQNALK